MKKKLTPAMQRVLENMTDFEKANRGNLEILWQSRKFYGAADSTIQALFIRGFVERAVSWRHLPRRVFYRKAML